LQQWRQDMLHLEARRIPSTSGFPRALGAMDWCSIYPHPTLGCPYSLHQGKMLASGEIVFVETTSTMSIALEKNTTMSLVLTGLNTIELQCALAIYGRMSTLLRTRHAQAVVVKSPRDPSSRFDAGYCRRTNDPSIARPARYPSRCA